MDISYEGTDQCLATIETLLNYASWIPIVHFGTAFLRGLVAAIEGVAGASFALLRVAIDLATFDRLVCYRFWRNLSYVGHAIANLVRAILELIPFSFPFTLLYDKVIARIEYKYERVLMRPI